MQLLPQTTYGREVLISFGLSLAMALAVGLIGGYLLFIQMPEIVQ